MFPVTYLNDSGGTFRSQKRYTSAKKRVKARKVPRDGESEHSSVTSSADASEAILPLEDPLFPPLAPKPDDYARDGILPPPRRSQASTTEVEPELATQGHPPVPAFALSPTLSPAGEEVTQPRALALAAGLALASNGPAAEPQEQEPP